jgi:hypothetical protein
MGLRPAATTDSPAGLFAISINVRHRLWGHYQSRDGKTVKDKPDYSWVTGHPHVARIGTSIDVYDLGEPVKPSATSRPADGVR